MKNLEDILIPIIGAVLIGLAIDAMLPEPAKPPARPSYVQTSNTVADYHLCLYRTWRKAN